MIGFLSGKLHAKRPPQILIDVNGVGYEIEAPMSTFYAIGEAGADVTLLTHMHVREDAMLLFGFATEQERNLFKELIKVNGIGAKMAIGILSAMSVNDFVGLVDVGDAPALTKIPGVGKKTAERLVIEMRDRLKGWGAVDGVAPSAGTASPKLETVGNMAPAIEALVSLGYKPAQAEKMVNAVEKGLSLEETIKQALMTIKL
ncbi:MULTISPECIES: Holliday junction branch migration protein RuvA [Piscirickettsiaceae]|jgi:Holliday junction DNA helicase RuvA|uniref:Holliday junction branch migration complex subunit RuvA n=1 Tax=Hydrogenovibrio thermophilus TaxID=265883 RepID=A0A410H2C9_9GAMM|nr:MULTISPECIES: Holliday junction branch migration protein RuvA [Piscirickettsiaceae]AZR82383.1 Holliday junction ATP-dependent DNA helicase RuvA [Thiomicrospira sp. S5]QAB15075.1 Holliday junction branch migration protein RuvA [Hydrogenovibrio thermophilus]